MLPVIDTDLDSDFELEKQPTRSYKMDFTKEKANGYCDGLSAMQQAIYKILNTKRYQHIIYSWNYGVELSDLFGQPIPYAIPEIKRRITEALVQDDRITRVDEFQFDTSKKGEVLTIFKVYTTEGEVTVEKRVRI